MVASLRQDQNLTIMPQTPAQFESALQRYQQAADKSWSLTDCASFEVMEAENIEAALTHDRHFVQAGFEALLRLGVPSQKLGLPRLFLYPPFRTHAPRSPHRP